MVILTIAFDDATAGLLRPINVLTLTKLTLYMYFHNSHRLACCTIIF